MTVHSQRDLHRPCWCRSCNRGTEPWKHQSYKFLILAPVAGGVRSQLDLCSGCWRSARPFLQAAIAWPSGRGPLFCPSLEVRWGTLCSVRSGGRPAEKDRGRGRRTEVLSQPLTGRLFWWSPYEELWQLELLLLWQDRRIWLRDTSKLK